MKETLALVLGLLAVLLTGVAIVAIYAGTALFDSDEFADRAVTALDDPEVQDALARGVADVLIEEDPELIPARPVIEAAAATVIDTESFEAIFRSAAAETHGAFFDQDQSVVLQLGDMGVLLFSVIRSNNPEFAAALPPELPRGLLVVSNRRFAADTVAAAEDIRALALIAPVVALLLFAAAVYLAADRRRIVAIVAVSLALLCGVLMVALGIVRGLVVDDFANPSVARAIWDAYLGDLGRWLLVTIGVGLLVGAVAASLLRPLDASALVRAVRERLLGETRSPARRIIRAGLLGLAGLAIVLEPVGALKLVAVVVGVLILFHALTEVMRVIDRPGADSAGARRATATLIRGAVAAGVAVVVVALGALLIGHGSSADAAQRIEACNGHAELCDRPVNLVAIGASHNSMSAAEDGHLFTMHDGGMIAQLDGGLRGFQIDTWYGIPQGDELVITELPTASREEQIAAFGQETVDAAERLRRRSSAEGERTTYLCHGYCEYGATPFAGELTRVKDWLVTNPNEVIVMIIQDAISPQDTKKAFEESGLIDLVYHHDGSARFPTLREMIASDQRVVVMAENESGGLYDWYLQGYDVMEETPFRAESPETLSCAPDRGGRGQPFFLMNNWIQKPFPEASDAQVVNSREFIVERAARCKRAGRPDPGIVAVNFWGVGALMEAIDELNGV